MHMLCVGVGAFGTNDGILEKRQTLPVSRLRIFQGVGSSHSWSLRVRRRFKMHKQSCGAAPRPSVECNFNSTVMSLTHRYPLPYWPQPGSSLLHPEYGGSLRQGCQRSTGQDRQRNGMDDAPGCVHFNFYLCNTFPRIGMLSVFSVGCAQMVAVST